MKTKGILIALTGLLVFLTGCDNSTTQSQSARHQMIKLQNVAWMREKLPAQTLAYARIPTIWQLLFEAKADGLHPAQKLEAHKTIISNIKKGLVARYANKLPKEAQFPFELLLKNMSSPLEIAVLNASDGSMVPEVMIATTLDNTTKAQISELLGLIEKQSNKQFRVTKAFDGTNFAGLFVAMAPVFMSFDEKTGRLLMLSGLSASEKQLKTLLAQNKHDPELDDIFAYEDSVDASGNNLETWINIDAVYQNNKALIPASEQPMVKKLGLDKMKFLWAGTASTAGKSDLIVKLAMPEVGARKFIAGVDSNFEIQTAGTPRRAWQFTRPTVEQITNAYEFALSFATQSEAEKARNKTNEIIALLNNCFGVSLADILKIYGQKIVVVTDDSGTWFASKIKDMNAHKTLIEKFKKTFKLTLETKMLAGVSIDVMQASTNEMAKKLIKDLGLDNPSFKNPFMDMKQTSYFQIKDDTYIQAFIPQVLADRENSKNKQSLSSWLNKQQGQNWDSSLLAYTTEVQDAPRSVYYFYLKLLEIMGNLTHSEVDLFTMPTARQLNLPEKGQFSFALDANKDGFSVKFSYEYSVFENMSYVDGYLAVVYLGVVSAYAVPAYQDYTLKLKVTQKRVKHEKDKAIVTDYYYAHNKFPDDGYFYDHYQGLDDFDYDAENGELTFYFSASDDPALQYDSLVFKPKVEEDKSLSWTCFSTVSYSQIPDECFTLVE